MTVCALGLLCAAALEAQRRAHEPTGMLLDSAQFFRSCILACVLSVLPLQAQVDTGSITGTVTDPSGAVVRSAKVTLTNEGTAASLTTTTGSDGSYRFSPVRIGKLQDRSRRARFQDRQLKPTSW